MVVQSKRRADGEGRINIKFIISFPSACFSLLRYSFLSHTLLNPFLHIFVMKLLSTLRLLLLLQFCFSSFMGVLFFPFLLNLGVLSTQSASTSVLFHISVHNYVQCIITTTTTTPTTSTTATNTTSTATTTTTAININTTTTTTTATSTTTTTIATTNTTTITITTTTILL